ncbi:SDR family oxidoreductase [Desulfobacterales bacterium HSG16]|nr:SDR family oxidoreductase [Desulfobacterales bacterium HSG16]
MQKSIFITGATSGFGKACAVMFAQLGRPIILVGRRIDRLKELQESLSSKAPIHIIGLDVRQKKSVESEISNLPEEFENVDILVNSAGLALGLKPSHETDLEDWETMIDTNIKGLVYCTRNILPKMVKRNMGHIINIGSIAGDYPYPGGNVYGATKAFVKQFSRNLRADLLGANIRVTNIEPGLAETEFSVVRFHGDAQKANKVYEQTDPLTAEDIAEIVFFVATLPPHINVNRLEVMPTCQTWGNFAIDRNGLSGL